MDNKDQEKKPLTFSDKVHHGEMKLGWDKNPVLGGKQENKTPIQQAIENIEMQISVSGNSDIDKASVIGMRSAISILKSLLPAEKKLLEDTWNDAKELFLGDLQSGVDRILRDKGASNKEVHDAINDTVTELSSTYKITKNATVI